jgi:hypothetical protein
MEHIEKIVIGLILFGATSVLAYLFRMRQLYVVTPKLFRNASISKDGSLCEIIIYNRGAQPEEAIQVELDPSLRAELLASGTAELSLVGSIIKLERLHKNSEASAILLIENGLLDSSKIVAISSKAIKGHVCKTVAEVPPNFARAFLIFLVFAGFFPAAIYLPKAYDSLYAQYTEYALRNAPVAGWSGLAEYFSSDLRSSYSSKEFPVIFRGAQKKDAKDQLRFDVLNKTAIPLTVYVDVKNGPKSGSPFFASVTVDPLSKSELLVPAPAPNAKDGLVVLDVSFKWGSEFIYKIDFTVPSAAVPK